MGNSVPHPIVIFLILIAIVLVLSHLLYLIGATVTYQVINPDTHKIETATTTANSRLRRSRRGRRLASVACSRPDIPARDIAGRRSDCASTGATPAACTADTQTRAPDRFVPDHQHTDFTDPKDWGPVREAGKAPAIGIKRR